MYILKNIYLSENSPEQATYAADELRYYLSMMCGASIPVQSEQMENSVILEQVTCPELGEDGFKLIPEDTSIRICGGKRGIIYGAGSLTPKISESLIWLIFLRKFKFLVDRIAVLYYTIYIYTLDGGFIYEIND